MIPLTISREYGALLACSSPQPTSNDLASASTSRPSCFSSLRQRNVAANWFSEARSLRRPSARPPCRP